jgi:hypothetical protein
METEFECEFGCECDAPRRPVREELSREEAAQLLEEKIQRIQRMKDLQRQVGG